MTKGIYIRVNGQPAMSHPHARGYLLHRYETPRGRHKAKVFDELGLEQACKTNIPLRLSHFPNVSPCCSGPTWYGYVKC